MLFRSNDILFDSRIAAVCFEPNGKKWVLTQKHNLHYIDASGKELQKISMDTSLIYIGMYQDREQRLWIYTLGNGLWMYDITHASIKQFTHLPLNPTTISRNLVNGVMEDENRNIWVYTDNGLDLITPQQIGRAHV